MMRMKLLSRRTMAKKGGRDQFEQFLCAFLIAITMYSEATILLVVILTHPTNEFNIFLYGYME